MTAPCPCQLPSTHKLKFGHTLPIWGLKFEALRLRMARRPNSLTRFEGLFSIIRFCFSKTRMKFRRSVISISAGCSANCILIRRRYHSGDPGSFCVYRSQAISTRTGIHSIFRRYLAHEIRLEKNTGSSRSVSSQSVSSRRAMRWSVT